MDVWLPLLTLVLGYVGSLVTESQRDKRAAAREQRARQAAAGEAKAQRREDFQRETLLELQDQFGAWVRVLSKGNRASRHAEPWVRIDTTGLYDEITRQQEAVRKLAARVMDDDARQLFKAFNDEQAWLVIAESREAADAAVNKVRVLTLQIHDRLGEVVRALY